MQLTITQHLDQQITEPLMVQLREYALLIAKYPHEFDIHTMEDMYQFIQGRIAEFIKVNPTYIKPTGLTISYYKPSCCPASISISYRSNTIKIISHEKDSRPTTPASNAYAGMRS